MNGNSFGDITTFDVQKLTRVARWSPGCFLQLQALYAIKSNNFVPSVLSDAQQDFARDFKDYAKH
jgi:hypothetical protein